MSGEPTDVGCGGRSAAVVAAVASLWLLIVWRKGRPFAPGDVFRASRLSRGNRLFPTQVLITPTSVVQYTPQWIGRQEESIHMAHIASVKINTGVLLSDVLIETSGGASPIRCHGHRKRDAVRMKALIESHQNDYYRSGGQSAAPGVRRRPCRPASVAADNPNAKMDDLIFSARRASAAASARTAEPADLDARFRTLVQSPLRAGILRYLNSRPDEAFDVESLMQTFGRLRLDVENCVRELADFGVARDAARARRRNTSPSGPRTRRWPTCSTRSSSAAPRSAPRISRRRSSASAK